MLAAAAEAAAPTWNEAANATYAGIMGEAIHFKNGQWQGEPYVEGGAAAPRAGLVRNFLLQGDLDGDGAVDSAVLVWTSTGGSGTFDFIVLLGRKADGSVSERASAPLGDRVNLRSAAIDHGEIVLDTVQAGPKDAACCPGQKMRRIFVLVGDTLKETSTEDRGRLSLADIAGAWKLTNLAFDEGVPPDIDVTLQVEGDRIAGRAACNRYTGAVQASDMPGGLALAGPLAVTRMMCRPLLMEWERKYLEALKGLRNYGFVAGQLALNWTGGEATGTLLFSAVASH